jgi:hypothetical protein
MKGQVDYREQLCKIWSRTRCKPSKKNLSSSARKALELSNFSTITSNNIA